MRKQDLGVGLESFLHVYLCLNNNSTRSCSRMPLYLHTPSQGRLASTHMVMASLTPEQLWGKKKEEQARISVTNCVSMRLQNKRNNCGVTESAVVLMV